MNILRIAFATAAAVLSGAAFAELPHIKNVTINPTPPGAKVAAAYLNIYNPADETLVLSKVSSPAINRVEIHKTEIVDDVAKMRKQDGVEIAADDTMEFTHGGYHIMLMDLEGPMMPGDVVPLIFHTNQGEIALDVRVADKIAMPKDSHSMDHGNTDHNNMEKSEMEGAKAEHDGMKSGNMDGDKMDHEHMKQDDMDDDKMDHDKMEKEES